MNRRKFLESVFKTSGIVGLCGIGLSLSEAKLFAAPLQQMHNKVVAQKRIAASGTPGLIGNNSTAASDGNQQMTAVQAYFSETATIDAGEIGHIHAWIDGVATNDELVVGIYNADGTTKLVESAMLTVGTPAVDDIYDFALDSIYEIADATTYRLCVAANVGTITPGIYYTSTGGSFSGRNIAITITGDSLPATLTDTSDQFVRYVVWGDNTSGH